MDLNDLTPEELEALQQAGGYSPPSGIPAGVPPPIPMPPDALQKALEDMQSNQYSQPAGPPIPSGDVMAARNQNAMAADLTAQISPPANTTPAVPTSNGVGTQTGVPGATPYPMDDTANLTRQQYLAMGINPDLLTSFSRQEAAKRAEGAALAQGSREKGVAIQTHLNETESQDQTFRDQLAEMPVVLKQKWQALEDANKTEIQARKDIPNRPYNIFDNKTANEKVGMSLAMGLGAILSPITGFRNQFYDMFRREADRDLAEKINAFNKAKDVSSITGNDYAAARQYGLDANQSIQFVKANQFQRLSTQMEEIAARTGSRAIMAHATQEAEQIRAQAELMKQNAFNSFLGMNLNQMIHSQPSFAAEEMYRNPFLSQNDELKKKLVPMDVTDEKGRIKTRMFQVNTEADAAALKETNSKIDPSMNALKGLMSITPENFKSMTPYIREHANMLRLFASSGVAATLPGGGKRLNDEVMKLSNEIVSNPTDLLRFDSNTSRHLQDLYNFLQSYKRTQLVSRGALIPPGLASGGVSGPPKMGDLNAP